MDKIGFNIWNILLTIGLWSYFIYAYIGVINKMLRETALSSKKLKYERLRRLYWTVARLAIRKDIITYCDSLSKNGDTIRCIMMYELDTAEYQAAYIMCGYDRLHLDVITKLEQIRQFVNDWRRANAILDSTEMLQLYLNEQKPITNDKH